MTPHITKSEFSLKNELDYKIKPLKSVFFFNNFSGVLYFVFDALIIELFKICLVMSKNSGKSTLSKVYFDVSRVRWGVSLAWEPSE